VAATRAAAGGASTAIVVRDGSTLRTAADLRGRRIATGRGSVGHYLVLRVLERAGLTPRDVTLVFLNPGDAKAAFASGAVDAWATWGAYVRLAELDDHARILADGQGLMSGIGFEAATDAAIAGKRAALADFLRRLAAAQRREKTHTPEYAAVLARETGLPPEVALYVASRGRGEPAAIDAALAAEEKDTLSHFVRAGVIPSAPDITGALDPSFNEAAGR
jgi:sulfonate transport system substrate-binding protein